jgi:hypothetical protein
MIYKECFDEALFFQEFDKYVIMLAVYLKKNQ